MGRQKDTGRSARPVEGYPSPSRRGEQGTTDVTPRGDLELNGIDADASIDLDAAERFAFDEGDHGE